MKLIVLARTCLIDDILRQPGDIVVVPDAFPADDTHRVIQTHLEDLARRNEEHTRNQRALEAQRAKDKADKDKPR
jgi:hypothetical protein